MATWDSLGYGRSMTERCMTCDGQQWVFKWSKIRFSAPRRSKTAEPVEIKIDTNVRFAIKRMHMGTVDFGKDRTWGRIWSTDEVTDRMHAGWVFSRSSLLIFGHTSPNSGQGRVFRGFTDLSLYLTLQREEFPKPPKILAGTIAISA